MNQDLDRDPAPGLIKVAVIDNDKLVPAGVHTLLAATPDIRLVSAIT